MMPDIMLCPWCDRELGETVADTYYCPTCRTEFMQDANGSWHSVKDED